MIHTVSSITYLFLLAILPWHCSGLDSKDLFVLGLQLITDGGCQSNTVKKDNTSNKVCHWSHLWTSNQNDEIFQ